MNKCMFLACKRKCEKDWHVLCDYHFNQHIQNQLQDPEVKLLLQIEEARLGRKVEKILAKNIKNYVKPIKDS